MKNKYCYDSLEDYLVTHPNVDVSERAIGIVSRYGNTTENLMFTELSKIPQATEYFKWKEKNK